MLPNEDYYENRKKLTAAIDRVIAACGRGASHDLDVAIEEFKTEFPSGSIERLAFIVGEIAGRRHEEKRVALADRMGR